MKKLKLTMAQALVKFLDNQYLQFENKELKFVAGVLAIFGHGNVVGLGEALAHTEHKLEFIQGYNEQSMGHIATAFAKQKKNKQILVVTSSVGPGAANMVTAAATATANRVPVLFLPGDVYANRQPDPVLQQIEKTWSATISTNDAFKPVSVYWDRISRPEQLMRAMLNAMLALTNLQNQGAVTIALPQDVQGEVYDYPLSFFKKRFYKIGGQSAPRAEIEMITKALQTAKQPLVICGGGVIYAEAEKELAEFVNKYQVPVAETQAGKSALVSSHPLNLGGVGVTGFLSANQYARTADLVLGLGTRYTDFTTASKTLFGLETKFININASRLDAKKMDGLAVVADIKATLQALNSQELVINNPKRKAHISGLKKAAASEINRLHSVSFKNIADFEPEINDSGAKKQVKAFYKHTKTKLTQTVALGIINNEIAKDAIVTSASGSLPGDMQRIWKTKAVNTYHVEYGYSCMGYEISAALGIKLASPKQEVYALVGDGAYLMLHTALVTALQEQQKITILLFNNSGFGCINNLQVGKGIASLGTEFKIRDPKTKTYGPKIMHLNFAQQAAGYGLKTYRASNQAMLVRALRDAKKQARPTLIEILVLPKTMTHDYDAWWRVGNAKISSSKQVQKHTNQDLAMVKKAKDY